jgi:Glycosyl hydrolase family 26
VASLSRVAVVAFVAALVAALVVTVDPIPNESGGSTTTSTSSTIVSATTTSTSSATPTTTTTSPSSTGLIRTGPSRHECVDPNFSDTGLAAITTAVAQFDRVTNSTVTCLSAYLNGEPSWAQWEHPWIASPQYGYTQWVAQAPQRRQLILQVDLIPASLADVNNPLSWEQTCASGEFNNYAQILGTSLVNAGLQNSVIRLGAEMNGIWEEDYVGPTAVEQRLWAVCFDNEVAALRRAPGENFVIDWNPNACNIPYSTIYPGSAYVDIIGLDIYDVSCVTPKSRQTFAQLANEADGIVSFEKFAAAQGKAMSFPEWGVKLVPNGDDPAYIDGMGAIFDRRDVAFETYFNVDVKIRPYLPLGTRTPRALAAFKKWFGNNSQ